jgi:hypothetical protein
MKSRVREKDTVRRQTLKFHVNFYRKVSSAAPDVTTLPMVIQTEMRWSRKLSVAMHEDFYYNLTKNFLTNLDKMYELDGVTIS